MLLCQNSGKVSVEVADDSLFGVAAWRVLPLSVVRVLWRALACSTRARSSCRAVVLPRATPGHALAEARG